MFFQRLALLPLPLLLAPLALLAQGPLTPPGSPAPLGKTLTQVEPRTDILTLPGDAAATRVISQPGSYYLTGDLIGETGKAGIRVDAANVTLDLNGFRIVAAATSTLGVNATSSANDLTVSNGSLTGWDTVAIGVAGAIALRGLRLHDLTITGGGAGIDFPSAVGANVTRVIVRGGTGSGIFVGSTASNVSYCTVSDAAATGGTLTGIGATTVSHCAVSGLSNSGGNTFGIQAVEVSDCAVTNLSSAGSFVQGIGAGTVTRCRVSLLSVTGGVASSAIGISGTVTGDSSVTTIGTGATNGGATGISGSAIHNCVASNVGAVSTATGSVVGIAATSGVVANCAVSNVGANGSTASVTGISAGTVTASRVLNARGASDLRGISAGRVVDCSVETVVGATASSSVVGFSSYRLATGCTALDVSNSGAGGSAGFLCPNAGETRACNAVNTGTAGIRHTAGGAIRGCTVSTLSAGVGILCDTSPISIEDNSVSVCANGISTGSSPAFVVRNRVTGITGVKFSVGASAQLGPIVNAAGNIASTSPWANFSD